jgi:hypothetical protein
MKRRIGWQAAPAVVVVATLWLGCTGGKVDPRVRIDAPARHVAQIAKSVNGSKLWQAYLDHREKAGAGPHAEFVLEVEQQQFKSFGGDYDPGKITFDFKAISLKDGRVLFEKDGEVNLDSFMLAKADRNATRDQIQEIAFKATEEKVYPYMDRWVNLAAIRAMGQEGTDGRAFESILDDLMEDRWTSGDMRNEAAVALKKIRGSD